MAINGERLWRDVAAELRKRITSDRYEDGDKFLTGKQIAAEFDVSAETTVKSAIAALVREGRLTGGDGRRGRRVRKQKPLIFYATRSESAQRAAERRKSGVDAWVADVADQGREGDQDIRVENKEAPPEVASKLDLSTGANVVVRRRVRTVDGKPHNLNDTWYPEKIAANTAIMHEADIKEGVIALMREMGYVQVRYTDELTARMPTPEECSRLRIPEDTVPVMVQYRVGYTETEPVKLTITVWPADRALIIWEFNA